MCIPMAAAPFGANPSTRLQAVRIDRPAAPALSSPGIATPRTSPSAFDPPSIENAASVIDAVRSIGAAPVSGTATPVIAPGAALVPGAMPPRAARPPAARPLPPRAAAIRDAGSDGLLILQQVRQGLVAPQDAARRFQDMLGSRDIRPGNQGRLAQSFGQGLARVAQQRAAMRRAARPARPAPPVRAMPQAAAPPLQQRNAAAGIRTRVIDGMEVLDAVGGADVTRAPQLLAPTLSDTLPNLDAERLEGLREVARADPQLFNRRIAATIDDAVKRAQALAQSRDSAAPGLRRGALARAFGFAIAAASLTGDQRFIDAVLARTEGLDGVGALPGLANIGRTLLADNGGAPLPAAPVANQMLQVHAQQLNLQAGDLVAVAEPLAILLGTGGLTASLRGRLGTGVAATASRTAPRGNAPPAGLTTNTRETVDGVFSKAGRARPASVEMRPATVRSLRELFSRPFAPLGKRELSELFSGSTIGDRGRLRTNLLNDKRLDLKRFFGWQAHHIIPWKLRAHPLIRRLGMNANHRHNGVPLPTNRAGNLSKHAGSHPAYSEELERFLDRMRKSNIPDDKLQNTLAEAIERTRQVLINGLPQLKKVLGGTEEAWKRHFRRLGDDLELLPD